MKLYGLIVFIMLEAWVVVGMYLDCDFPLSYLCAQ